MFKVNNKDTWTYFTFFSSVSINFEQVIAGWDKVVMIQITENKFFFCDVTSDFSVKVNGQLTMASWEIARQMDKRTATDKL